MRILLLVLALLLPAPAAATEYAFGGGDGNGTQYCTSLAAGELHTIVLLSNGKCICFGYGYSGALGYGNKDDIGALNETKPINIGYVSLTPDGNNLRALQVNAGWSHSCALIENGKLKCWGENRHGNLGLGHVNTIGDDELPSDAPYVELFPADAAAADAPDVLQFALGRYHTCVLFTNGKVKCFGFGSLLGYANLNDIGDDETPAAVGYVNISDERVIQLSAGTYHTCALVESGRVTCWGRGEDGRLGYGNERDVGDDEEPAAAGYVDVSFVGGMRVVQLSCSADHSCALLQNGRVTCWGFGGQGQLGYGNTDSVGDDEVPAVRGTVQVSLDEMAVTQISAGFAHTCVIMADGRTRCWGADYGGQLGLASTKSIGESELPRIAPDVNVTAAAGVTSVQVTSGWLHTCILLSDETVKCWGTASSGQLGYGDDTNVAFDFGTVPADYTRTVPLGVGVVPYCLDQISLAPTPARPAEDAEKVLPKSEPHDDNTWIWVLLIVLLCCACMFCMAMIVLYLYLNRRDEDKKKKKKSHRSRRRGDSDVSLRIGGANGTASGGGGGGGGSGKVSSNRSRTATQQKINYSSLPRSRNDTQAAQYAPLPIDTDDRDRTSTRFQAEMVADLYN